MKQQHAEPGVGPLAAKAASGRRGRAKASRPEGLDREHMVREAAYFHYQARGCIAGHEVEDWLRAEAEIERSLGDAPGDPARH
jgi:hypothetical protein